MQFKEYAESQKWHIGRGITKKQQIPKEFDQRKRMYNLSKELKFACLWRLENNFVFDQNFPYNNIMQLKGDKHEIENTQQEFPRPCLIYRSNYEDFKCFNNKIRWFDAWLNKSYQRMYIKCKSLQLNCILLTETTLDPFQSI